jgi:hypothetical protein
MKIKYIYDAACDWYIRYEIVNKVVTHKTAVNYYYGKTNIPTVRRDNETLD